MLGLLSYKSLGQMQQSRELLQQSLAAVPLRSPVRIYVEKSSEDGTIFRRALPLTSCAGSRSSLASSQPSRCSECRAAPAFGLSVEYAAQEYGKRSKTKRVTTNFRNIRVTSPILTCVNRSLQKSVRAHLFRCPRPDITRCSQYGGNATSERRAANNIMKRASPERSGLEIAAFARRTPRAEVNPRLYSNPAYDL
jgi:hypothetical protein